MEDIESLAKTYWEDRRRFEATRALLHEAVREGKGAGLGWTELRRRTGLAIATIQKICA